MKEIKKENKNKKGFTLIELLIVIAIIGILASVVLVSLANGRDKAKVAAFKNQVSSVQASAVSHCDSSAVTTVVSLRTAIGILPAGITWNTTGESASCGSTGAGTFTLNIDSTLLSAPCTATLQETGVTLFSGC